MSSELREDILGREIKDGDLCVGMAIGRDSKGMNIGVWTGTSMCILDRWDGVRKTNMSNIYLISNPTEEELKIKAEVLEEMRKKELEKAEKAKQKTIPLKELEIGGVYEGLNGGTYIYLGSNRLIIDRLEETVGGRFRFLESVEDASGNIFSYVFLSENDTEEDIINKVFNRRYDRPSSFGVLKGNKKLVKLVRKVDISLPFTKIVKTSNYYGAPIVYRITIE